MQKVKICYKCFQFGHTKEFCRKPKEKCINCGEDQHMFQSNDPKEAAMKEKCTRETKCINCSGNHLPTNAVCPKYQLNKEIMLLCAKRNISPFEARKELISTSKDAFGMNLRQEKNFPILIYHTDDFSNTTKEKVLNYQRLFSTSDKIHFKEQTNVNQSKSLFNNKKPYTKKIISKDQILQGGINAENELNNVVIHFMENILNDNFSDSFSEDKAIKFNNLIAKIIANHRIKVTNKHSSSYGLDDILMEESPLHSSGQEKEPPTVTTH